MLYYQKDTRCHLIQLERPQEYPMDNKKLLEPVFLDDDGQCHDLPPVPTITNARELFGLREDETLAEALARRESPVGG